MLPLVLSLLLVSVLVVMLHGYSVVGASNQLVVFLILTSKMEPAGGISCGFFDFGDFDTLVSIA